MGDDALPPAPSLFLARNDFAHREHQHEHRHHHHIHKRQAGTTVQDIQSVVTEVVATVSYLQQIDVDSTGSTFSTQVVLAPTPATTENSAAPATTTPASPSAIHDSASGASSTNSTQASTASQSLSSSLEATSSLTSTPSVQPSAFPSLAASSNSTTLISSSSSLSAASFSSSFSSSFSNSSTSSTSSSSSSSISSSLTYSTSSSSSCSLSSSSSTSSESSSTSTSSLYSPSSSSYQATSTGAGGIGAGGTGATSGGTPSSTAASGNNSSSNSNSSNTTPKLLGGVLGGLAGLALLGFLLLLLIKWWKRKQSMIPLGNGNEGSGNDQVRDLPPSQPSGGMAQRRSLPFAVPAALASLTGYNKRASQKTQGTASSTAGSERGFYRVSGRKLPSVLQTGGDGYGGGVHDSTLSGSSFYRDSTGFYGGPGSPPPTSFPPPPERDSGIPVMRPSPARTPVTEHGPFGPATTPPPPPPLTPPTRPDLLGRSHPSQDGSHASRFTEEV